MTSAEYNPIPTPDHHKQGKEREEAQRRQRAAQAERGKMTSSRASAEWGAAGVQRAHEAMQAARDALAKPAEGQRDPLEGADPEAFPISDLPADIRDHLMAEYEAGRATVAEMAVYREGYLAALRQEGVPDEH